VTVGRAGRHSEPTRRSSRRVRPRTVCALTVILLLASLQSRSPTDQRSSSLRQQQVHPNVRPTRAVLGSGAVVACLAGLAARPVGSAAPSLAEHAVELRLPPAAGPTDASYQA
jgi:hypothetical protein